MTRSPKIPLGELRAAVRGALAFPITPYTEDGSVALEAVAENARWLPGTGIAAIVAPSGTGEFFSLTGSECLAIAAETVRAVAGRVPVVSGVGINVRAASELAGALEEVGVDGIMILPPYYAKPDSHALLEYYRSISRAVSIGVMIYARDSAIFTPDMVVELADSIPNLIAFKDGRGDVRLFQRIRHRVTRVLGTERLAFLAGVGDDMVGPYFAVGAEGFTSSIACFWPEIASELYQLARAGAYGQLDDLYERVVAPIYEMRQQRAGFEVSVNKEIMTILGYTAGKVRPPLANLSDADLEQLASIVSRLNIPTAEMRWKAATAAGIPACP